MTLLGLVEAILVVDLIVEKEITETNIMEGVDIMEVMVVLNILAHFQLVDLSYLMADNLFTLAIFKILMVVIMVDNFLHFNMVDYSFIMVDNFLTLVVIKVLMVVPFNFLMENDLLHIEVVHTTMFLHIMDKESLVQVHHHILHHHHLHQFLVSQHLAHPQYLVRFVSSKVILVLIVLIATIMMCKEKVPLQCRPSLPCL
ncbi:hypothetical protein ACFX1S_041135 [Malus domestica]